MINVFFQKHKLEIVSATAIIVVVFVLIGMFTLSQNKNGDLPQNATPSPAQELSKPSSNITNGEIAEGNEESLENRPGLQKTERLQDGSVKNYYTSPVSNRPNIIVSKGPNEILFQRSVTDPSFPVKITDYIYVYGSAKWIFKGSKFYGSQAQTHVYPDSGIAFIARPQTGEVLEQHIFQPMLIDDYVKKYGDDIQNPTPGP